MEVAQCWGAAGAKKGRPSEHREHVRTASYGSLGTKLTWVWVPATPLPAVEPGGPASLRNLWILNPDIKLPRAFFTELEKTFSQLI